jgi:hypothetical protein
MSNLSTSLLELYEPPVVKVGSPLIPGQEGSLAPGVRGYAVLDGDVIAIPLIIAETEGSGAVGKFLDSLSPRCVIPCVTSPRLMGMLARRGWIPTWEKQDSGEEVDIWKRPA